MHFFLPGAAVSHLFPLISCAFRTASKASGAKWTYRIVVWMVLCPGSSLHRPQVHAAYQLAPSWASGKPDLVGQLRQTFRSLEEQLGALFDIVDHDDRVTILNRISPMLTYDVRGDGDLLIDPLYDENQATGLAARQIDSDYLHIALSKDRKKKYAGEGLIEKAKKELRKGNHYVWIRLR